MQWNSGNTNDWSSSSVQSYLNGDYYNSLSSTARNMITNINWNLGMSNNYGKLASEYYTDEKGTTVYSGRPTTWNGYIALPYLSDFGFAVGYDVRSTCLSASMAGYAGTCSSNDWMWNGSRWTLNGHSTTYNLAFVARYTGNSTQFNVTTNSTVVPTLYLNTNVYITSGSGTSSDPYTLG